MENTTFVIAIVCALIGQIISDDIPGCDYFDTVDLTHSKRFPNGTYQYEDILIPPEKVGQYNYQILFDGDRESVPDHTRGCACHVKSCIRFCCDPRKVLIENQGECGDVNDLKYSYILNITMNDGTTQEKDVRDFIVQKHLPVPCKDIFIVNLNGKEEHKWTLFENGTLRRHWDGNSIYKQDYCLQPFNRPDDQFQYTLQAHHCLPLPVNYQKYVQAVTIFFMLLIIIVYQLALTHKSVHFKCCQCYFVCLTISFILLLSVTFGWITNSQRSFCLLIGYTGYYTVMATFLWLLIITYNLWRGFKQHSGGKINFTRYNIFVWGTAALLFVITVSADLITKNAEIPNTSIWTPGFGLYGCWINTYDWSAFLYFFGPLCIIILCNITFFINMVIHIIKCAKSERQHINNMEGKRKLGKMTYVRAFCRLFVIVGIIWILEVVSYFCSINGIKSKWITVADYINSAQGITLFIVTILRKDVFKSLSDRFAKKMPESDANFTLNLAQDPHFAIETQNKPT